MSNRWQLVRWVDFTAARLYVNGELGGDDLAKTSGPVLFVEQMENRHQFPELLHAMERGPALIVFRTKQPGLRHLAERYGAAGVTDDDGFTRYVARVVSGFVDRLRRICGDRWQQRHPEEAVNVCGGPSAVRGDLPSRQVGGRFELNGDGPPCRRNCGSLNRACAVRE